VLRADFGAGSVKGHVHGKLSNIERVEGALGFKRVCGLWLCLLHL